MLLVVRRGLERHEAAVDDAVQGPAADLRQAAVRLNGPAPALLPAHEIQQQGLAPVACGRGEWRGRTRALHGASSRRANLVRPEEPEWAASTIDRTVGRESWSLPSLDPFLLELSVTTVDEDAAEERRRLGPGLTGGGSERERGRMRKERE